MGAATPTTESKRRGRAVRRETAQAAKLLRRGPARGTYRDFVIVARRLDARRIGVGVDASPAGRLDALVPVPFTEKECAELHARFLTRFGHGRIQGGRMLIKREEAAEIGKRLAGVLFPPDVFRLFATSLVSVSGRSGLRIRLSMDPALLDMPWEYALRPDRQGNGEALMSNFLLLDPSISLVRQTAGTSVKLPEITGSQRMAFVGTLWDGKYDGWQVNTEFELLEQALAPVKAYIRPDFTAAHDKKRFSAKAMQGAAIFHYAGHADFDENGRAYLIRELPTQRAIAAEDVIYLDELGPMLGSSGMRLAVLSACNSGYWAAVKPLLNAGVPVVVGVNGGVASASTIEFCAKLYESLAVGLSLDEAVGRARLHILEWGAQHDLFDWGLYMVHMACPEAALFPRRATSAVKRQQRTVRKAHAVTIDQSLEMAREMDGLNFGEIMSRLAERRVLILGRFTPRRLAVLKAIAAHLKENKKFKGKYEPQIFVFAKPKQRSLVESIVGFAAFSRFVIADLSEPKSIPQELEAIAPRFRSVPIVPIIVRTGKSSRRSRA